MTDVRIEMPERPHDTLIHADAVLGWPEKVRPDLTLLRLRGDVYRCECGCNVFRSIAPHRWACNACGTTYTSESDAIEDAT